MRPSHRNHIAAPALRGLALVAPLIVLAFASASAAARAQSNMSSGLDGYRYRIGVGLRPIVDAGRNDYSDLAPTGGASELLKADYSFFRPSQAEGLASLWFVNGKYDVNGYAGSTTLGALTGEYRVRFFGHGIGYFALGGGFASRGIAGTGIQSALTLGLGIDFRHFYIEDRSLAIGGPGNLAVSGLFVGARF